MRYTLVVLFYFFFACLFCFGSVAQVRVKAAIDKNSILIGEQIQLSIEAYAPLGETVVFPDNDTLRHFEYLNRPVFDTSGSIDGKMYSKTFTITSFDSGHWIIPQLAVQVGVQSYYTDTLGIDVTFNSFDPTEDYHDIKNIQEVIHPLAPYIPWGVGLVTLFSIGGLVYFLRRKKEIVQIDQRVIPSVSIYENALSQLENLKRKQLSEKGMIKEYYTEMNDILRGYLAGKMKVSTMEKTNEEIILQLRKNSLSRDTVIQLSQALQVSDSVKFAKYKPSEQDNTRNFEIIESAIHALNKNL